MAHKDIISKNLFGEIATDIANHLLGLHVDPRKVEMLGTEKQRIEERRADVVARMHDLKRHESFILHLELQNRNDTTMPVRMLRYLTDIQLAYPEEKVRQYLVYIGKSALNMPDGQVFPDFHYRYSVLDMHTVDCNVLLERNTPEALVLAILCDFKERPAQDIVNHIVLRLHHLLGDDERGFRDHFRKLETLVSNRDLQANLEEAKNMLTEVNVKNFASYRWGLMDGRKEMEEKLQEAQRRQEEAQRRQEEAQRCQEEAAEAKLQQERIDVARQLLAMKLLTDEQIASAAHLTLAEVQALHTINED